MNKKGGMPGPAVFFLVGFLVLGTLVGLVLVRNAIEGRDPAKLQKDFLAKDIATLQTLLYGLPHNFQLIYSSSLWNASDYKYDFAAAIKRVPLGGLSVIVLDQKTSRNYKYIPDGSLQSNLNSIGFLSDEEKPLHLFYERDGVAFSLSSTISEEVPADLFCSGKIPRVRSIVLDPGHGSGSQEDTGFVAGETKEEDRTLALAQTVGSLLSEEGLSVSYTRRRQTQGESNYKSLSDRVSQIESSQPDFVLSFHTSDRATRTETVKAYYPHGDIESRNAACALLKRIAGAVEGVDGAALIPVNIDSLHEDDPLQVLNAGSPAVQLEIGSVRSTQDLSLRFILVGQTIAHAFTPEVPQ